MPNHHSGTCGPQYPLPGPGGGPHAVFRFRKPSGKCGIYDALPDGQGAITNYLNSGHAVRRPSGKTKRYRPKKGKLLLVPGKGFYETTRARTEQIALWEAQRWADSLAKQMQQG